METIPDQDLCAEITHQYTLYKSEPQERNRRGQLIDPVARMFEQRMNNALQQFGDYQAYMGQVVMEEMGYDAA